MLKMGLFSAGIHRLEQTLLLPVILHRSQQVRHDDQVDALGLIGQLLDRMIPAQRLVKPTPKKDPGFTLSVQTDDRAMLIVLK